MARMKDRSRRRRLRAACGEDRLSALPDDLLLDILRRVDTRTALGAAALSRRWAHLPREVPALDLKVSDTLPRRCHRCLLLRREARKLPWPHALARTLTATAERYERRAMRSMAASVKSLLASRAQRRVDRLSLEVFDCSTSPWINSLVVDAVDSWGLRDLEVVATATEPFAHPPPVYRFPHGRISGDPGASRLRSLKLGNCLPPPLQGFAALTTLVLKDLPRTTRAAVYEGVLTACPQLQVLHIVSCRFKSKTFRVSFDAPMSDIRELVVDGFYMTIEIRCLPKLESHAVLDAAVLLCSDAAPCLKSTSFVFSVGPLEVEGHDISGEDCMKLHEIFCILTRFFQGALSMTDLVLRFTEPGLWIALKNPFCPMQNLRRLLVVDVPSSWDVSGPDLLVEAAPLLESLHVHVPRCQEEPPGQEIERQPSTSRHYRLKELVIIGFQRTERHLRLVRYAIQVSTALRRISLFKHGHVEDKGACGWEMVTQQSTWSNEEKFAVLDGIAAQIEAVLG